MMITRSKDHESNGNEQLEYQKLSELLSTFIEKDQEHYLQAALTNGLISNGELNVTFKSEDIIDGWKHVHRRFWYHPMHQLSPYLGRFPPAICRYFICKFSRAGEVVYDPFCGSGTVPLEACLLDREAVGNDVFIYAYILSHAKVNPLEKGDFN